MESIVIKLWHNRDIVNYMILYKKDLMDINGIFMIYIYIFHGEVVKQWDIVHQVGFDGIPIDYSWQLESNVS